jgi:hypothetical protein
MCYQLVLVSPLTLSEVRAMLEPGMRADAIGPDAQGPYRALLRGAQTAVILRAGWCACGLLPSRFGEGRTDEVHLRERYRRLGVRREVAIQALERHRRSAAGERPAPGALARFVAEHARNAGPSAWLLGFSAHDDAPMVVAETRVLRAADAQAAGDAWLAEGVVVRVER